MTLDLRPGDVLEDLKVNKSTSGELLQHLFPMGMPGMCTILYHDNDNAENMAVPTIQPQRAATKLATDATSTAQEPNYVSDDKDDEPLARRRQSPRLNKFLEDKHPDRKDKAPHRIVVLHRKTISDVNYLLSSDSSLLTRKYSENNCYSLKTMS